MMQATNTRSRISCTKLLNDGRRSVLSLQCPILILSMFMMVSSSRNHFFIVVIKIHMLDTDILECLLTDGFLHLVMLESARRHLLDDTFDFVFAMKPAHFLFKRLSALLILLAALQTV